ncbi:hypothetical protein KI387_022404, partial [Taxus chinensis]
AQESHAKTSTYAWRKKSPAKERNKTPEEEAPEQEKLPVKEDLLKRKESPREEEK